MDQDQVARANVLVLIGRETATASKLIPTASIPLAGIAVLCFEAAAALVGVVSE